MTEEKRTDLSVGSSDFHSLNRLKTDFSSQGVSDVVMDKKAQAVADSLDLGQIDQEEQDTDPGTLPPAIYYFHPDHLGSSTIITDGSGFAYQLFLNLPFGETMAEQRRTGNFNNVYKFNGKELDTETGLYYYGARYYDPRVSNWLSVDPLAEKFPSWSPYNYALQNPIRYIDPDGKAPTDIIYLNTDGSIKKVVKDGKAHITIVDDGKNYSLSSYHMNRGLIYWNNRSRRVVANIAGYYGKQVGVSGIGATYKKEGVAYYSPSDKGIWISPQNNGTAHPFLNNKYNLQNVLKHEEFHKEDHANGVETTFSSHASVYIKQMADDTFKNTTKDYQLSLIGSMLSYILSVQSEEGGHYSRKLIKEFNETNQGGYKLRDSLESGYGWPIESGGKKSYISNVEAAKNPH